MAPAVGRTEMRYFGISLFSRLARVTSALWPAVPTGGVPQRISCCAQAAEFVRPARTTPATRVVRARWSMVFPRGYGKAREEFSRRSVNPGTLANAKTPRGERPLLWRRSLGGSTESGQ